MKMKETSLFDSLLEEPRKPSGPVTCLGMTFENDEARRAHFTEELRKKLQDPEFRKIEGFPIGSDEDILNLSDPPYYTACPNPWVADFIAEWEAQKPKQPEGYHYHREPFATDVSEGKNDPIYNAHSYHTKVPHKAIMRYILHYTQPGNIVFDGFCGTGMTGVAAQMCGDREVVMSLGYQVKSDGTILREEVDEYANKIWRPFSKLGVRRAVLNDLSPAATFIAYNYNTPVDVIALESEAKRIVKEVEEEYGWMYETIHTDGKTPGKINYTVWSDVFVCSECANEVIFWENALDKVEGKVKSEFPCPHCGALLNKKNMKRSWASLFDKSLGKPIKQARLVPVLINYSVGNKRFEKIPDEFDLKLINTIEETEILYNYPSESLQDGFNTKQPLISHGLSNIHHFYTKRNLHSLALWVKKISGNEFESQLKFAFTSAHQYLNKLCRLHVGNHFTKKGGTVDKPLENTLYMPSISLEVNVQTRIALRARLSKSLVSHSRNAISTFSSTERLQTSELVDYIFIDPPFGANINYSEVSALWEGWLRVKTNTAEEAIVNNVQRKDLDDYRTLMRRSFEQAYALLKPGRWMTIEFSNTKASVWNCIQTALSEAGFIVASVSALDKKKGSHKAVTTPTAVKQDLVISAYKPNGGFEKRFEKEAQTEEGVWEFVRTHLKYLRVTKRQGALMLFVPERDPRILFDQMIAFYVRKGYPVPISSQEFQLGLSQRFIERDGMYFLPDQVAEYDRKKMSSGGDLTENIEMFVKDEESMIKWLRHLLKAKPQTFSDINPQFMQQLGGWSKNEAQLDLRELLNQNFLCYDGKGPVPEQIHAYLSTNWKELRNLPKDDPALVTKARDRWYVPDPNKAGDLEKLREKALLKEFEEYKEVKKKLKVFRLEAVRAGFKKAWQERDYAVIVAVADKIPNNVLEEDPKLLMWYDQAVTRMGGE
jgi:DNA modification methylase